MRVFNVAIDRLYHEVVAASCSNENSDAGREVDFKPGISMSHVGLQARFGCGGHSVPCAMYLCLGS